MNAQADRIQENKKQSLASAVAQRQVDDGPAVQLDSRPEVLLMRKLRELAGNSPQAKQVHSLQTMADNYSVHHHHPIQRKENNISLPGPLRSGVGSFSGYALDDVKMHYNSDRPDHHGFFELTVQEPAINPLDVKSHSNSAVAQRAFSVQTEDDGNKVTGLKIKERPFVKERLVELDAYLSNIYPNEYESTGELKAGAVRAHIIGWNIKSKEYVSRLGLPMKKTDLIDKFQKESIQDTIQQIKYELTNIFYDKENYTINSTEAEQEDRDALRAAGQRYSQHKKIEDLKKIYTLSFNAGKYGHGGAKVKEYQESFSRAYDIDLNILKQWELRLPEIEDNGLQEEEQAESGFYTLEDLREIDKIEDYGMMLSVAEKLCKDYDVVDDALKKQYINYVKKIHDELMKDDEAGELYNDELSDMRLFLKNI